ncbi:MAG: hypothetical protein RLZZ301_1578 [Bacteroidota bacterium]|jgi:gliding motility-associated-like protein
MRTLILLFLCGLAAQSQAQTLVFAQLNGSPTMATTGWNLAGAAAIGDTPGDPNVDPDELILTQNVGNSSGAIFFNQPIDLSTCYQWNVQFDFRMYDGTAADGIAFCFLDVPPTGYVSGGGVGIPSTANGIKVVFDTYNNCGGANPEIQIYNGPGYNECIAGITTLNNIGGNLSFLRSYNYNTATISYNYGVVTVSINGTQYLTGNYNLNFLGYLGFTASTGGSNDRHSIKNVQVYADIATSNAGPDVSICSGQTAQIGSVSNPNYTYSWTAAPGLSQTSISNPTISLTNTGTAPITQQYLVTTNLISNPSSCPSHDSVLVTVNPLFTDTLDVTICPGSIYTYANQAFTTNGIYPVVFQSQYACDSTIYLHLTVAPSLASSQTVHICSGATYTFGAQVLNVTGTYTQVVNATTGCDSTLTLNLVVDPPIVTNLQQAICQGASFQFNGQFLTATGNYSATLQSIAGCDSLVNLQLMVNPVLASTSNFAMCQGQSIDFYGQALTVSGNYSHTLQTVNGCDSVVTLQLTVFPIPDLPQLQSNSPVSCPNDLFTVYVVNADPNTAYSWTGPANFIHQGSDFQLALGFAQVGAYTVVASANGCSSAPVTLTPSIVNIHTFEDFEFPNVLTADHDGINDALNISAYFQTCQQFTLVVINRWGQLVYEGNESSPYFEGLDKSGSALDEGIYFYKLSSDGIQKSGFFHLLR